jgi:hypothetical protein
VLLLLLLPLKGLLGLRLLDIFLGILRGLGEPENEDDLPRLGGGPLPLRGEIDLERERAGLRGGGDRLRLRFKGGGDLFGGLRTRLGGGDRRLRGGGERLRTGLPRVLRGEDGERPLGGDLL